MRTSKSTHQGLFMFNWLVIYLKSTPAIFQSTLEQVLVNILVNIPRNSILAFDKWYNCPTNYFYWSAMHTISKYTYIKKCDIAEHCKHCRNRIKFSEGIASSMAKIAIIMGTNPHGFHWFDLQIPSTYPR